MKKTATNVAFVVATLMIIAGAVFWLMDGKSEDGKPAAKPTVQPVVLMSTDGVEDNIERRLAQREGRQIKANCPKKVDQAIGTTFTCQVFFVGRDDAIAVADVKIDGPNGEFSWKSQANVTSTPATSPA